MKWLNGLDRLTSAILYIQSTTGCRQIPGVGRRDAYPDILVGTIAAGIQGEGARYAGSGVDVEGSEERLSSSVPR